MTDNQGLLTRIALSLPYPEPFPSSTLGSDWDITHEIANSLRTLKYNPLLAHVKGHQDSEIPYERLTMEAQLNVNANAKAGYFQCMFLAQRPIVPRILSNHAQLHISGQVICFKIKQRIRDAFTIPPYLRYVKKRFKWTPAIVDTINWPVYTPAISRFRSQQIHITKLCNDLLLTA